MFSFLIMVLLALSLVSADVSYSCSSDSDCELYTDLQWSCVVGECVSNSIVEDDEPGDVREKLRWDISKEDCDQEGCISFAPASSGNWYLDLWDFLFKAP
tara:strand:+ start:3329 stop:3628 length:300 start_codon:yes stop_codon:yes gene_type:complete